MPIAKLKEFLDRNKVRYVVIHHSEAFTAQEVAASAHVSGRELAKTVMVMLDGKMAMAVLPASRHVGLDVLKKLAGAREAFVATEAEFKSLFPDSEVGAMPPFGNLYDLPVFVDQPLTRDREIAFNAGSHRELVRMEYKDFERLAKPKVGEFGLPNG